MKSRHNTTITLPLQYAVTGIFWICTCLNTWHLNITLSPTQWSHTKPNISEIINPINELHWKNVHIIQPKLSKMHELDTESFQLNPNLTRSFFSHTSPAALIQIPYECKTVLSPDPTSTLTSPHTWTTPPQVWSMISSYLRHFLTYIPQFRDITKDLRYKSATFIPAFSYVWPKTLSYLLPWPYDLMTV